MSTIQERVKEQITQVKDEILSITNQIEVFRNEGDEADVNIMRELQDKLEILSEKVSNLQKNLSIYQNAHASSAIQVGTSVSISNSNVKNKVITLVMPEDADPVSGFISSASPLGNALLEKKSGESVQFATPGGVQEFTIEAIEK
ncbi:GreA/GreB family elongation factor [Candidatus Dojkabacteria bacterium]|uniref:GreA/GreB family elongation factor n=1 Tax=Candidatus Dojkabacteria bacterium TaxID=2099670 RepID=A0A955L9C3_9BACT|nr:GreA/GreB family elongation factor [Candidatus Dojkabacteria bacterium]